MDVNLLDIADIALNPYQSKPVSEASPAGTGGESFSLEKKNATFDERVEQSYLPDKDKLEISPIASDKNVSQTSWTPSREDNLHLDEAVPDQLGKSQSENTNSKSSQDNNAVKFILNHLLNTSGLTSEQSHFLRNNLFDLVPTGKEGAENRVRLQEFLNSLTSMTENSAQPTDSRLFSTALENLFNLGELTTPSKLEFANNLQKILPLIEDKLGESGASIVREIAQTLGIRVEQLLQRFAVGNSGLEKFAPDTKAFSQQQKAIPENSGAINDAVSNLKGIQLGQEANGITGQKSGTIASKTFQNETIAATTSGKTKEIFTSQMINTGSPGLKKAFTSSELNDTQMNDAGLNQTSNTDKSVFSAKAPNLNNAINGELAAKNSSSGNAGEDSQMDDQPFNLEALLRKSPHLGQIEVNAESSGFSSKRNFASFPEQLVANSEPPIPVAEQTSSSFAGANTENVLLNSTAARVATQIQESIQSSLNNGRQQITVQLYPPELGKVFLKFEQRGDALNGFLQVSRTETRYDIEQALPQVIRNLSDSGIQIKRVEVSVAEENNSQQQGLEDEAFQQENWQGNYQTDLRQQDQNTNGNDDGDAGEWFADNEDGSTDFAKSPAQHYNGRSINMLV